jgi:hypothetical protein
VRFVSVDQVESVRSKVQSNENIAFPTGEYFASRTFFGDATSLCEGPQAFLVDSPRESRTGAHFHTVAQFQIFFPTDGTWYQNNPLDSILVQYADAYTAYGPFGSAAPMSFFTLRARSSVGILFMPGARERLRPGRRRQWKQSLDTFLDGELAAGESKQWVVHERESDGLAAYLLRAGPGSTITSLAASTTGGEYSCVLRGSVIWDGDVFGPMALGWRETSDEPVTFETETGADFLVLQFGEHAATEQTGADQP